MPGVRCALVRADDGNRLIASVTMSTFPRPGAILELTPRNFVYYAHDADPDGGIVYVIPMDSEGYLVAPPSPGFARLTRDRSVDIWPGERAPARLEPAA